MKFTLPLTILAVAVSVDAAVVADVEKRYCSSEGQPCDTVRRAAEAFAGAIDLNTKTPAREDSLGNTADIAARQLHELALTIGASYEDADSFFSRIGVNPNPNEDADSYYRRVGLAPSTTSRDAPTEKRDASPWCTLFPNQPCWKRDAASEAVPDKVQRAADPWCTRFPMQPCWKRSTPVTAVIPDQVKREPAPWCTLFPNQPCWKRDATSEVVADQVVKRGPEPSGWCTLFPWQPCWKRDGSPIVPAEQKRDADAEAVAEPDRYCTRFTGSSCWKRDGSEATIAEAKRCDAEGGACWQAKRAALAVVNTIDMGNAIKMARDANAVPSKVKREAAPWCTLFPNQPCWKREASCHGPSGLCTKATRDLHAMYNAARSIIES